MKGVSINKGRKIICVQNVVISGMLTHAIAKVAYSGVTGWRWLLLFVAVFWLLYRTLDDVTALILKGVRRDKKAGRKGSKGSIPGTAWHKVRFADDKQAHRDSGYEFIQVS